MDFNAKHHVQTFCLPCFVPKLISSSLLAEQIEAGSKMVGSENMEKMFGRSQKVLWRPRRNVPVQRECSGVG